MHVGTPLGYQLMENSWSQLPNLSFLIPHPSLSILPWTLMLATSGASTGTHKGEDAFKVKVKRWRNSPCTRNRFLLWGDVQLGVINYGTVRLQDEFELAQLPVSSVTFKFIHFSHVPWCVEAQKPIGPRIHLSLQLYRSIRPFSLNVIHHQNASTLHKQFSLAGEDAHQIIKSCPACPDFLPVPPFSIDPRGLSRSPLADDCCSSPIFW